MAKTAEAKKNGPTWINLNDPELFDHIREKFARRDGPPMPLLMMVRIALGEWLKAQK